MSDCTREKALRFHMDRSQEATTLLLKSITDNPSISADEKCSLLISLARHHQGIVQLIAGSVISGKSLALANLLDSNDTC